MQGVITMDTFLLIQSRNQISKEPSIKIMQYNFSEAQSGKDLCDSETSHSKLHMLRFADEGNDILGPCDMKTALDCYGGLRGTYSSVISVSFKQETLAKKAVKIPGISYMNNFEFKEDGIYAKRAYNVDTGKFLKNADLNIAELNELKHFQIIKPFPNVLTRPGHVSLKTNAEIQEVVQNSVNDQPDVECVGFSCTEPGCTKEFLTGRGLEQHILTGKHDFSKRPATDSVKQMWIDKCNSLNANFFSANSEFENNANEEVTVVISNALDKQWPRTSKIDNYMARVFHA
ncbi:unnamed protein product [Mytilus coruscus]|uniref:C2H2-type domain-containing protein n=1 Tax=Mytilus coruscus TaxID=42192 RepID=A0A6J8ANW8_MYTCO|nr:unnamed protein product [Mytilus coruscus]